MFKNKLKPQFGKLSIILLAVIAVLIASDLLTKFLEEKFVWNAVIIPNFIVIKAGIRNQGCAFSFLDKNPFIGQPVLITLTFLLLAVLIFGFIFLPKRFIILRVAISMLIAGAIGNLIDRFIYLSEILIPNWGIPVSQLSYGGVRDWFGLNMFGSMAFCNFADFWIVLGAVLAVVDLLFLNEYAVIPLTKSAKEAQKAKKEEEEAKKAAEQNNTAEVAEEDDKKSENENENGD